MKYRVRQSTSSVRTKTKAIDTTKFDLSHGEKFDLSHALFCKKGGMVMLRHNELRDITTNLLKEICHDVRTETPLVEVNGEVLNERTANTRPEARLDIKRSRFLDT